MRREYHTGMRWCLWRWKDIESDGSLYLRRLHIFQCPWFIIMMHWIFREDRALDVHDHPIHFISFILKGAYFEQRDWRGKNGQIYTTHHWRIWFNFVRAADWHKILHVSNAPVVTFCIGSRKIQDWGFWTSKGKVLWKDYPGAN